MRPTVQSIVFVWPGDLHLTQPDLENHRIAHWVIDQVNDVVRPDFVQFAGDNAQEATEEQFALVRDLSGRLHVPHYFLAGDHDVHHDPQAQGYRTHLGDPYGAFSLRGVRFNRLNTVEHRPVGFSPEQIIWFQYEVDGALARGEQVVVFQHHYPFKVCEDYSGPGVNEWRDIVQSRPISAIFCGHTHYGQTANDGRNLYVATRSIGDPEGGPAGYAIVFLQGDDLALTYPTQADQGPIVLITHPRDLLLATRPAHIVTGADQIRVRVWSDSDVNGVRARIDDGDWLPLEPGGTAGWGADLPGQRLRKGHHRLTVQATDAQERRGENQVPFMVDRTGRFTAVPGVRPPVELTAFC